MDFYLITGFLGAGKTTFLQHLVTLFQNKRLYLIINEFGASGVDPLLLQHISADMAEISNGSIFCACRLERFEQELERILQVQPDVVITEASGLADPTNIQRVLDHYPAIDYRGSICLADAVRLERVFSTAQVCPRQLAVASLVLLNKTDLATPAQRETAYGLIQQVNPAAQIKETQYGHIERSWLSALTPIPDLAGAAIAQDITLQKTCLAVERAMPKAMLEKSLVQMCETAWRIKGFVQLEEGGFFVDCTGPLVQVIPWQGQTSNLLVLLAGKGMPLRKTVKSVLQWYQGYFREVKEV